MHCGMDSLRSRLIKLAHSNPELRKDLLPLLGKTGSAKTASRQELTGHVSAETAYVVNDYPYGSLRTQMRYWLEYKPKKGWRLVSQSLNPKTDRWNKPHPGVYTNIAASMYLDSQNHVQWTGVSEYTDGLETADFLKTFRNADRVVLKVWIPAKIRYISTSIKMMKEKGVTGWVTNGVEEKANEYEIQRKEAELEQWTQAAKYL